MLYIERWSSNVTKSKQEGRKIEQSNQDSVILTESFMTRRGSHIRMVCVQLGWVWRTRQSLPSEVDSHTKNLTMMLCVFPTGGSELQRLTISSFSVIREYRKSFKNISSSLVVCTIKSGGMPSKWITGTV